MDISEIFGKTLQLYQDYSDILIVYKKTKFMHDLYNDIRSYVQKVKVILTNELEAIKNQDVVFQERIVEGGQRTHRFICPIYQKRVHDIIRYLVLIVCTQNQPQVPGLVQSSGKMPGFRDENPMGHINPEKLDKETKEVLRMRNQLVNNYKQAYQKIKLRQLQALTQDVRSYK